MKPLTLGGFVLFVGLGIYHTFVHGVDLGADDLVELLLLILAWTSGIYFYYLNAATEDLWTTDEPRWLKGVDFILALLQFIFFDILWFLLDRDLIWYAVDLCLLSFTYSIWDFCHHKDIIQKPMGKTIYIFDLAGLALSIALAILISYLLPLKINSVITAHDGMWVVIVVGVLIYHSLVGLTIAAVQLKYVPFRGMKWDSNKPSSNNNSD